MSRFREPVSGFTHLGGMVLSIAGLVVLLWTAITRGTAWHVVSFAIFGTSLILLYGTSALYHLLRVSAKKQGVLRRLDHVMIYVLIAGSYTPFCLIALRGPWGWSLLIPVWVAAVAGMVMSVLWLEAPRWLYTLLYGILGWAVTIATKPLLQVLPQRGFLWFLIGGLFYTFGAVIYGVKWPRLKPGVFGFHELWHLFVMAGSLSHYWVVLHYVAALP